MPVYLRKNISFSPPSLENIDNDNIDIEDDFSADPELMRDKLPQPYRMINKILDNVMENSWTVISKIESKRTADLNKIRPPVYDCAVKLENYSKLKALSDSVDGRYIFLGMPNGITVLDSLTQTKVASWEEEKVDVVYVKCYLIGVQTYLLVTIDELGVAKLFIFAAECIFLLKVLNEQENVTNKVIVSKCEASEEGDYIGLVLENTAKNESWLEVHRLPRDTWLREMETVVGELQTLAQQQEAENESADQNRNTSPRPASPPPLLTLVPGEKPSPKFTPPTLVLKINPPSNITASTHSSLFAACQKVDSGEVIGTGQNHILSGAHLDLRDSMFNHLNEKLIPFLKDDDKSEAELIQPTFHFVTSSRLTPIGLEQPSQTGRPTTIIVWWSGESHLKQYSLLKISKDVDYKPELVWPFANKIKSTAISSCGTFLAIGLSNGTVALWDRYLGIEKGIIRVEAESSITQLQFLHQSISSSIEPIYPPYKTSSTTCLLIQTSSGSQYLYNSSINSLLILYSVTEDNDDAQVLLTTMTDVPELILVVTKDGSLMLKDVTNGNNICQVGLPTSYTLTSPWEPIYCFGGGGQMLYVKGSSSGKDDEGGITDLSALFLYQFRSFPSLDKYWKRPRDSNTGIVHPTLEKRVNSLLKYRIEQQPSRKERMQQRWGMMKQELDVILQCQETAKRRSQHAMTASTYRSTPPAL